MNTYVLTRSDMEHRILESVHFDAEEAEAARQALLKRYDNAPQLCTDTEVDGFTVEVWVATLTKGYGCTGEDPETTVLAVGTRDQCLVAAQAEVVSLMPTVTDAGDEGVETEDGWRGVDGNEDAVYRVQLHKL
jgi:hypothetical protein